MIWKKHDYEEIPGTYVFDGKVSHTSYALNRMLFSFNQEKNRLAFDQDPAAFATSFGLTFEQKQALLEEDYLELLRLGANVYFLAKLAVPRGMTMQDAGAAFQGITTEEFKANLQDKATNLEEKLQRAGGFWHG